MLGKMVRGQLGGTAWSDVLWKNWRDGEAGKNIKSSLPRTGAIQLSEAIRGLGSAMDSRAQDVI